MTRGLHNPRSRLHALRARLRREDGNALVEFAVLAAAILIPSLYLVLTMASVQSAVFAADVLARDAARIHATETDPALAQQRTDGYTSLVLEDFHLQGADVVTISCTQSPCATAGGMVQARVRIPVQIPGLGPVLGGGGPVAVTATQAVAVDRYSDLGA